MRHISFETLKAVNPWLDHNEAPLKAQIVVIPNKDDAIPTFASNMFEGGDLQVCILQEPLVTILNP